MKIRYVLILALLLAAFGYVGEQDYQIKAAEACEAKGGNWDGKICVKECNRATY